ncbi:hypothetical protein L3X38_036082 [Prunus dulcis]|uniref:Uncharacterized protein n=1 Tax=Prunus dulcis TaxID=3755 RepID=A0AAD4YPA6_PRUDU|nr:hypothetical protein L3X38_036082 [Prunus dulcis]
MWDSWGSLRRSTRALTGLGGSSEVIFAELAVCFDWSFDIRCRRSIQGSRSGALADLTNMYESVVYVDYLSGMAHRVGLRLVHFPRVMMFSQQLENGETSQRKLGECGPQLAIVQVLVRSISESDANGRLEVVSSPPLAVLAFGESDGEVTAFDSL